jgi:hypothetical protein
MIVGQFARVQRQHSGRISAGWLPFYHWNSPPPSWRSAAINSELIAISWHGVSVGTESVTHFHQTTSFLIALETRDQNENKREKKGTLINRGPDYSSGYRTLVSNRRSPDSNPHNFV